MKIEIAEPGRMTQSGSSLLKLIQNNNMPILDLLVRESIQNSLDAKNEIDDYVSVEFITGKFNKRELNNKLQGITDSLNNKFKDEVYKFIAIKDSNTVGLTGKLHYDEVKDNQYGNLLKLIYEISKPQEANGAGGSWGLGKTVYFRVGIGLVIYYSRILNEKGEYESRLAASLVENELNKDSLIPVYKGKSKRGIAWWGEEIGINKTRPIINDKYIRSVLEIFGIEPYDGDMTGTTIIIPYINEKMLLENNQIEYKNGDNIINPFWRNNIEDYLSIAVQRWYAPRLNNIKYPYGKFLRVKINGNGIALADMEPSFQIIQALYNRAMIGDNNEDILSTQGVECKTERITLRKVLKDSKAGTVAFAKVTRKLLKTDFPDNKPEPYMYFNCEIRDKEKNKPIVSFTRKPGMIVSFEDVGNWVDGINSSNKDEFIIAIFVLNSDNKLTDLKKDYSLEEYIRKSEMADHTSWGDFSIGNFNPRIVSKIQGQVNNKISKEFLVEEDNTSKLNSGLGKLFGDILLPPENFGKKPSPGTHITPGGKQIEKHKSFDLSYDPRKTRYSINSMTVNLEIKAKKKIHNMGVKLAVDSENGAIDTIDWEVKMGLSMPFEIERCSINLKKKDGDKLDSCCKISHLHPIDNILDIQCKLIMSDRNSGYSIQLSMENAHLIEVELIVSIKVKKKDVKPLFVVDKEEHK